MSERPSIKLSQVEIVSPQVVRKFVRSLANYPYSQMLARLALNHINPDGLRFERRSNELGTEYRGEAWMLGPARLDQSLGPTYLTYRLHTPFSLDNGDSESAIEQRASLQVDKLEEGEALEREIVDQTAGDELATFSVDDGTSGERKFGIGYREAVEVGRLRTVTSFHNVQSEVTNPWLLNFCRRFDAAKAQLDENYPKPAGYSLDSDRTGRRPFVFEFRGSRLLLLP